MTDNKGRAGEPETSGNEELILPSPEDRTYISLSAEAEQQGKQEAAPPAAEAQKAADAPIIPESGKRVYINLNKTENSEHADKDGDGSSASHNGSDAQAENQDAPARKVSRGIDDTQELPPTASRKITLPPHNAIRELVSNEKYRLEHMIARGAESVLYRAKCDGHLICVKAVRNSVNKWLGDSITRNQEERLEKVSYRTKLRHIQNEFNVSKLLYSEDDTPTVHIYALRRISRMGLELGYDLIMEYLTGHDLGDKILSRTLTLTDKVNVFYRAIKAVAFMHQKKLIHLDIKPSNFMLVRDQVKLIDFGVSVPSGHRPRAITGTSGYLSPEQICKDTLDEGTDIFALGVAFAVFFGGKSLNQPQEMLLQRQTRQDMQYHLNHDVQPVVNEAPDLNSVPPIFEVLRACTIPRRDLRINKCEVLLNLLRQKAEQAGIKLMD
ncbi:MAG: protein kinase [Lentisphaerae bacterium]|nr:protein kinase [Lentisphaerota bacterium]